MSASIETTDDQIKKKEQSYPQSTYSPMIIKIKRPHLRNEYPHIESTRSFI